MTIENETSAEETAIDVAAEETENAAEVVAEENVENSVLDNTDGENAENEEPTVEKTESTEAAVKKKSVIIKKLKPIIITAIVCVIVAGLGIGAYYLFPQRENIAEFAPAAENEDIKISDKSAKMVESIEVKPANGEYFEIV